MDEDLHTANFSSSSESDDDGDRPHDRSMYEEEENDNESEQYEDNNEHSELEFDDSTEDEELQRTLLLMAKEKNMTVAQVITAMLEDAVKNPEKMEKFVEMAKEEESKK